jgi:hypothetical protein
MKQIIIYSKLFKKARNALNHYNYILWYKKNKINLVSIYKIKNRFNKFKWNNEKTINWIM